MSSALIKMQDILLEAKEKNKNPVKKDLEEQKNIFRNRAKESLRELHGYYNTESRDPPLTQMERRQLDEEITQSIEDILTSLETIATMNEKELRDYQ